MGFHLDVPRISALSKNMRNGKRLLIELEEQINRFEADPRSKEKIGGLWVHWKGKKVNTARMARPLYRQQRNLSTSVLDFAFPKSYLSASQVAQARNWWCTTERRYVSTICSYQGQRCCRHPNGDNTRHQWTGLTGGRTCKSAAQLDDLDSKIGPSEIPPSKRC